MIARVADLDRTALARQGLESEVCVVGTGPAGITIALALARSGIDVVLLEAGEETPTPQDTDLYKGKFENPISPKLSSYTTATRQRFFGGTSNHWGGWCRPLDPIDFESRDWVPGSGWPIDAEVLAPYYRRAAGVLDIKNFDYDAAQDPLPKRQPLRVADDEVIKTQVFHMSKTRFAGKYRAQIAESKRIRCLLGANLTHISLNENGDAVRELKVSTLNGDKFSVRAKRYVLATGGIENARLLLSSDDVQKKGIGNQFDLVGRNFMDHMDLTTGHLVLSARTRAMRLYSIKADALFRHRRVGVLVASEAASRAHKLRNCCLRIDKRLRAEKQSAGLRAFAAHVAATDGAGVAVDKQPKPVVSTIRLAVEATPNPLSRISLSNDRDALGMRRVHIDWKVDTGDFESVLATHQLLARELGRTAAGRVHLTARFREDGEPDWSQARFKITKHHMGTTRMADDPAKGVTDKHCKVHGVDNLFVAGSSVFCTGGYANPTLTIVALALRIAEHLAESAPKWSAQ